MANQPNQHSNNSSNWLPFDISNAMSHMLPEYFHKIPEMIEEEKLSKREDESCKYSLLIQPHQSNTDGNWMFGNSKQCVILYLNYKFRNYLINEFPDGGKYLDFASSFDTREKIIQDYVDNVEISNEYLSNPFYNVGYYNTKGRSNST